MTNESDTIEPSLFDRMVAWDNLWLAYRKAAKGKRGLRPAAAFEQRVADRLLNLQDELLRGHISRGRIDISRCMNPKNARSAPHLFVTAWCIMRCVM